MSIYDLFEENVDEADGFILEVQDGDTSVEFKLARAGSQNKKYVTRLQALMKPYKYQIDRGTMKEDVAEAIMAQVIAETIILGWKGVTDRDGEEMEYTPELAKQLLLDLPALRNLIMEESQNVANFLREKREEREGN